jgi:hypothetical protein
MASSGPVYLHPCFDPSHETDQGTLRKRSLSAHRCNTGHELGSMPDSDRILRYGHATACAYLEARDTVWIACWSRARSGLVLIAAYRISQKENTQAPKRIVGFEINFSGEESCKALCEEALDYQ